ncbi:unnamed protein product [Spirodela intermedia]|uniref:Uncharacterized protein n=1 Tax=Spirodela intermedia TaxID=51605 RepID=A0A7I8KTT2_SPIIN|nr:unnamed protein product [Spirodela intermedia]
MTNRITALQVIHWCLCFSTMLLSFQFRVWRLVVIFAYLVIL